MPCTVCGHVHPSKHAVYGYSIMGTNSKFNLKDRNLRAIEAIIIIYTFVNLVNVP